MITIEDNGRGLPDSERERLTEPYVTTREKGTGLGLAIVKKIMEEHGGTIWIGDGAQGGACARLIFPKERTTQVDGGTAAVFVTEKADGAD